MRLRDFVVIRALTVIPMILLLFTMVFVIMRIIPGDPIISIMGTRAGSEKQIEIMRHALGLDKPLHIQYLEYLGNLLRGDFGRSFLRQRPVIDDLLLCFPATLELTLWSMLLAIPLGIYLGIASAKREGSGVDAAIRIGVLIRWCMPIFWLGVLLQIIVVLYAPILPLSGRLSPTITLDRITGLYSLDSILTGNTVAFVDSLKHLILPVVTLGTTMGASLARLARVSITEVLDEEYIKVVRLKGCPENKVFNKHVLPNALIPILTYAGLQTAMLMGGAVLTETVFSWPGLGKLMLVAVQYRDFNLIQGCTVFFALIVGSINLIIDALYVMLDPRVRY